MTKNIGKDFAKTGHTFKNICNSKKWDLAIVGLGYIGMHLGLAAMQKGLKVVGIDNNQEHILNIYSGKANIDGIPSNEILGAINSGFKATSNMEEIKDSQTVTICVPTPLNNNGEPDHTYVLEATRSVAQYMEPDTLICLESTVAVGTTEGPVREILEHGGKVAGNDFFLAFAPERINPGDPTSSVQNVPRVIGGVDDTSTNAAKEFYSKFVGSLITVPSAKEAELAKLLENTYRYINLAFINELGIKLLGTGIDLHSAITAASTKPYGFEAFWPGPGVGGHCIPIDPIFLQSSLETLKLGKSPIITTAHELNNRITDDIVKLINNKLSTLEIKSKIITIGLIGIGYKSHVFDVRNSPAFSLAKQLKELDFRVVYFDDHIENMVVGESSVERAHTVYSLLDSCDLIVRLQPTSIDSSIDILDSILLDLRPNQG